MKLLRRNLSLMLAVRYLNPLRTMFSIITLICLGGVALGVMVLIVVLSVMEGLQKEIEDKAMAFEPHYVVALGVPEEGRLLPYGIADSVYHWRDIVQRLQQEEGVESAYPLVEGDGFAQKSSKNAKGARMTIRFSSIQPGNEAQMAPLKAMLKEGTFDFGAGLDEECVISKETADQLGLQVGDTVRIAPLGDLDEVVDIYNVLSEPELVTHKDEEFKANVLTMFDGVAEDAEEATVAQDKADATLVQLQEFFRQRLLRPGEKEACNTLGAMLAAHRGAGVYTPFSPEEREEWDSTAALLFSLDREKENGRAAEDINEISCLKDLKVVGIYQAPENIGGPNLYMPLPIAQEALRLHREDCVRGICVRMKDFNKKTDIMERIAATLPPPAAMDLLPPVEEADSALPPRMEDDVVLEEGVADSWDDFGEGTALEPAADTAAAPAVEHGETAHFANPLLQWAVTPWTERFEKWSRLIANERTMMSFVLSIISLIASFCIMAVMFTMSIQRKREIAVLQALGATPRKIMGIFAWQGFIIGLIGSVLGVLLALLVLHYRLEIQAVLAGIGMDPFPMQAHGITLPANYDPVTFTQQALTAFVMVVVAAIIPAFIVSRQDPAKALRSN